MIKVNEFIVKIVFRNIDLNTIKMSNICQSI